MQLSSMHSKSKISKGYQGGELTIEWNVQFTPEEPAGGQGGEDLLGLGR